MSGRRSAHLGRTWRTPVAFRRRLFGLLLSVLPAVLVLTLAEQPVLAAPSPGPSGPALPVPRSVPVSPVPVRSVTPPAMPQYTRTGTVWPAGGSAVIPVDTTVVGAARSVAGAGRPGGLPMTARAGVAWDDSAARTAGELRSALSATPPASVRVSVATPQVAEAAGVRGVVFAVERADGQTAAGSVALDVDYAGFKDMFGANFGARLRLVRLPACALTTPELEQCQSQTPVAGAVNTETARVVSVDGVDVTGPPAAAESAPAPSGTSQSSPAQSAPAPSSAPSGSGVQSGSGGTVLALTSGSASSSGDFTRTSLSPSYSWAAGQQGGGFSTSIPIAVPPGLGGPQPDLALTYSSSSVDGMTLATNSQASWIGSGWDLQLGYIERSFTSCSDDGTATGDLCWKSDGAGHMAEALTMVFGQTSTRLVRDDATASWRPEADDGSRVELLGGAYNYTITGEHWRVTTVDGTQYYFGLNRRFAGDRESYGAQVVPVYGNHPGEPCYNGPYANSSCNFGYRWNLDYVVDPRGNTMRIFYTKTVAVYGHNNSNGVAGYDINAFPTSIEYGTRSSDQAGTNAPMKVLFGTNTRCPDSAHCQLDVPWDQYCALGATYCPIKSPTFWMQLGLASITTQVWNPATSSYRDVDRWELSQGYPDPQDGTSPSWWLGTVTRTGLAGSPTIALPRTLFYGALLANRVDYGADVGVPPLNHWRIGAIDAGMGGLTRIQYSGTECVRNQEPDPDQNSKRCFPVYFKPTSAPAGWGWFHKYVVDKVVEEDLTGGGPTEEWAYTYSTAGANTTVLWGHDDTEVIPVARRSWSIFRGYSTVTTTHGATGGPQTVTRKLFYRGLSGDRTDAGDNTRFASITDSQGNALNDLRMLAGLLREESTLDNGALVAATLHHPTAAQSATRSRPWQGGNQTAYRVREAWTIGKTKLATSNTWRTTQVDTSYNSYGLPVTISDWGEPGTADDVCTDITYTNPNTSNHLINYRAREFVHTCVPAGSRTDADHLKVTDYFWDNATSTTTAPTQGLLTKTRAVKSITSGTWNWFTVGRAEHDQYGRVTKTYDGLDWASTIGYTPTAGGPVTHTTFTNPAGHVSVTAHDGSRGLPVTSTDPNNKVSTGQYDALGRLVKVWLAGRPTSNTPDVAYGYTIRADGPNVITTTALGPNGNQITSYELFDGRLRPRQRQSASPHNSGGRIIADSSYDSRGQLTRATTFWNATAPGTTLAGFADSDADSQQRLRYDNRGRRISDELWSKNTLKWQTTTGYDGDRTTVTPPAGGTATTTIFDARGQVTELRQHTGPTPTGGYDATRYGYDRRGNLSTVTDPLGNQWAYTIDLAGRLIQQTDPDAGAQSLTYDNAGQRLTSTDSRGEVLAYRYDELGRLTELRDDSPTGTLRASWTYDTLAKGQITKSSRHVGGDSYTFEVVGYTDRYQPTGVDVVIPIVEGALAGRYRSAATYRVDGSPDTVTFPQHTTNPTLGGLAAETLTPSYTTLGYPSTVSTSYGGTTGTLITGTSYTEYGEPIQQTLSTGTGTITRTMGYDPATRRVTSLLTTRASAPTTVADVRYSYDPVGNITKLSDVTAADHQCFRYDYLQRLTEGWTPTSGDCTPAPDAAALGGPAKYWQSWTFDKTGNRLQQTDHVTPAGVATTTYTYPTPGASSVRPHTVSSATTVDNAGSRLRTYGYDNTGNTTSRPRASGTGSQTLTWDAEGRLSSVADGANTHTYLYDPNGQRLLTKDPGVTTLHLGAVDLRRDTGTGTVTATRYVGGVAVRAADGLTWTLNDHQGTINTTIRSSDQQITTRRQTPYGEPRGPQPNNWIDRRGFLNGTQDPTGLTHLGAREYDPTIGRFASVDPVGDLTDPQQLNGYSYANNNPTTLSDPAGLKPNMPDDSCNIANPTNLYNCHVQWCETQECDAATDAYLDDYFERRAKQRRHGLADALSLIPLIGAVGDAANAVIYAIEGDTGAAVRSVVFIAVDLVAGKIIVKVAGKIVEYVKVGGRWVRKTVKGADYAVDASDEIRDLRRHPANAGDTGPAAPDGPGSGPTSKTDQPTIDCTHSFDPATKVLMADGTTKPIKDVRVGDRVAATDPQTGRTEAKQVTALHRNDDLDLVDVTVHDDTTGATTVLHTTRHHPFWVSNTNQWTDAADLQHGDRLLDHAGATTQAVVAVKTWTALQRMHDLTVADIHTYYVTAGTTPVLVHNCGENQGVYVFPDAQNPGTFYIGSTNDFDRRLGEWITEDRLLDRRLAACVHICGNSDDLLIAEQIMIGLFRANGVPISNVIKRPAKSILEERGVVIKYGNPR